MKIELYSYCKKQSGQNRLEKKFSPLKWYTDSDLEEDELYSIVKQMFTEVDVAITLDLAAGGPAVQVAKNVP